MIIVALHGVAQETSNLIIFASDSTPFYAIVNGIKQNPDPQINIKINGLLNNQNHVKIVFSNGNIPDIDKNFYFESMNVEATARIVSTEKGNVLRYFGEVAMGQAATNEQQVQVIYQSVDSSVTNMVVVDDTVMIKTTSVNDSAMNNNFEVSDTATNTSSGMNAESEVQTTSIADVSGYKGKTGCIPPLSDVNAIKNAVEKEDFSDKKIMIAKQALKGKCMSVQNIITITESLYFEDEKLEFAKFAYDYTYDVDNFHQLNKIFDFTSSKEELNEYLSKK
tara:strand:- start:130 stop:966 length:837 start_codon:yes stop_codon:yes gene_type:complete